MKRYKHILYLIGIIAFICLFRLMNWNAAVAIAKNLDLLFLILAALMSLGVQCIKPFRWQALLDIVGYKVRIASCLRIYLIGGFWGGVTPARIGDFCRVVYARRLIGPEARAGKLISTVMIDRLLEIFVIIGVGAAGLLFFPASPVIKGVFAVILAAVIGLAVLYVYRRRLEKNMFWMFEKIDGLHPVLSFTRHARDIWDGMRSARDARITRAVAYNLVAYVIFYLGIFFLSAAFSLPVSWFYICVAVSTAMVISIIPISIAGLGSREAVLLLFFMPSGITYEQTLFFSMMYLLIFIIFPALLGAVTYFLQPAPLRSGVVNEAKQLKNIDSKEETS